MKIVANVPFDVLINFYFSKCGFQLYISFEFIALYAMIVAKKPGFRVSLIL